MWTILGLLITGIIAAVAGIGTSYAQNQSNTQNVENTNEVNLQAVRETNSSNVEQANLAYRRSLPTAQVKNLMDAGFSRAGAIQKITGGGTYTAPTLQSSHGDSPQVDYSGMLSSIEHLQGIPSSVQQAQMIDEQRNALRIDTANKIAENVRANEKHKFEMWQSLYGKKSTEMLDSLSNKIVSDAADKGINLDSIDTIDKLVSSFDLDKDATWRNMPRAARQQILDGVRMQAAENRAAEQQENANDAAEDSHKESETRQKLLFDDHELKELDKALKRSDLSAPERDNFYRLAKFYAELEKDYDSHAIAQGQVKEKDLQNALTIAGFDSMVDAINAKNAADAAAARYEHERTDFHGSRPRILKRIVWTLDKLNPLNGLFKINK